MDKAPVMKRLPLILLVCGFVTSVTVFGSYYVIPTVDPDSLVKTHFPQVHTRKPMITKKLKLYRMNQTEQTDIASSSKSQYSTTTLHQVTVDISTSRTFLKTSTVFQNLSKAVITTSKPEKSQNLPSQQSYIRPRLLQNAPKRYASDREGFRKYKEYLNKEETPLPKQKRAVLILTNYRSGSSFFGELFKQHPDVFYIYEPLWPLCDVWDCTTNRKARIDVLEGLLQCDLPDWKRIYYNLPERPYLEPQYIINLCRTKNVCFRSETTGMCSDRHCPRGNSRVNSCDFDCGDINLGAVNNDCRKKKMVAMKVIRLCDINDLEEILKKIKTDVKVLHLLRDPRGIGNSASHLGNINVTHAMEVTCKKQGQNFKTGFVNTPDWLKGKYKAFRYEDLAMRPYDEAQAVYDFVGLRFPIAVKRWIETNTKIKAPVMINRARRGDTGPYGTTRDSKQTVQKWVKEFQYSKVKKVESVCSDIMHMAGYEPVGSMQDFRDRTKIYYQGDKDF